MADNNIDHKKFGPMLDTFTKFASERLGIKSMPTMQLGKEDITSSFGGYNPQNKSIVVISKNRHPMDIFRTVAHELVHHKQNEDGKIGNDIAKEGATGSEFENEANAEAGKIMRWFAKKNPEAFKSGYVVEETKANFKKKKEEKNKEVQDEPSPPEKEQALRLNVQYLKNGQWGRKVSGQVMITHKTNDKGQLVAQKPQVVSEMKNDPCWKGYQMIGKKKKNGKEVPNCVPVDEAFDELAEEIDRTDTHKREWGTSSLTNMYKKDTPGQSFPENPLFEKKKEKKKLAQEDNLPALGYEFGNSGIGDTYGVVRSPNGLGTGYSMPMTSMSEGKVSFRKLKENWEALGGRDSGAVAKQGKEEIGEEDVIKTSKTLKGYKKNIHPMSTFEKKAIKEDWQKVNRQDKTDGLSQKAVNAYRRENPGSKLKTAVTEKNPKGKRAKRRLSFCRRMSGVKKSLTSAETARDPDSRINKALRRWNCE